MWTCANMIKSPHPLFLSSHALIPNLHSFCLCHSVFVVSKTKVRTRCSESSKIYKIIPLVVFWFVLTLHFILEEKEKNNWLLFWYNCGLHWEEKKKNHLLKNLFFYASAVNVHIVAVWRSMIEVWSVVLIVSVCEDHSGEYRGFQKYYVSTSHVSLRGS